MKNGAVKTTRLPHALTIALGQYFLNAQLAQEQLVSTTSRPDGSYEKTYRSGRPRNSDLDTARVFDATPKTWGVQRCGQSFWFTVPKLKKHHYYTDVYLWPMARIDLKQWTRRTDIT
jgi:hypothetical protein